MDEYEEEGFKRGPNLLAIGAAKLGERARKLGWVQDGPDDAYGMGQT